MAVGQHPSQPRRRYRHLGCRAVGRGGGERNAVYRRWRQRRTCSGGSAKRQDLLEQSRRRRYHHDPGSWPHIGVRESVSDYEAVPDLRSVVVCTGRLADAAYRAVAVALARAVEVARAVKVTQSVEVPVALALRIFLTIPFRLTVTIQDSLKTRSGSRR